MARIVRGTAITGNEKGQIKSQGKGEVNISSNDKKLAQQYDAEKAVRGANKSRDER